MTSRANTTVRVLLSLVLVSLLGAKGCGGGDDIGTGDPTIELLTPEPGTQARQTLAISGRASGAVKRVTVRIDDGEPIVADGIADWTLILDVSTIADGSHVVRAKAEGTSADSFAETAAASFISLNHAPPSTIFIGGFVRDNDDNPLPGASVALFSDPGRSTTTDLNGRFALAGLVPGVAHVLRAHSAGLLDTCMFEFVPDSDVIDLNIPMFDAATFDFVAGEFGVTRQPGTATVFGFLIGEDGNGFAGATIAFTPPSGSGAFYGSPNNVFDPGTTATTAAATFFGFNMDAGPLTFSATASTAQFFTLGSRAAPDAVSFVIGQQQP